MATQPKPDTAPVSPFMRDEKVVATPQGPVYAGSIAHQIAQFRDRTGANWGDNPASRLKGLARDLQSARIEADSLRDKVRFLFQAGLVELQALPPGNRRLTHDLGAILRSMGQLDELHRRYRDVIDELESVFDSVGKTPEVGDLPDPKLKK